LDLNVHKLSLSGDFNFSLGELNCSWEVFIKDSDLTESVSTLERLISLLIEQDDVELKVGVPSIIIDDGNLNSCGVLLTLE
jgi:hypothetical protein